MGETGDVQSQLRVRLNSLEQAQDRLYAQRRQLETLVEEFANFFWEAQQLVESVAGAYRQERALAFCAEDLREERTQVMETCERSYERASQELKRVDQACIEVHESLVTLSHSAHNSGSSRKQTS